MTLRNKTIYTSGNHVGLLYEAKEEFSLILYLVFNFLNNSYCSLNVLFNNILSQLNKLLS